MKSRRVGAVAAVIGAWIVLGLAVPAHAGDRSSSSSSVDVVELVFAVLVVVLMGPWIFRQLTRVDGSAQKPAPIDPSEYRALYSEYPAPVENADVTVLRIAIDARARPFVRSELERIAPLADIATPDGRATRLREVAVMLRRLRDSWLYGGADNEPMMPIEKAQQVFQSHVDDARARFRLDATGALRQTSDDGPGVLLVSVVVAARHELLTVKRIGDGEELRRALEAMSATTGFELVAVEIVWTPADDAQRVSSIALEAAYPRPDLFKLAGAQVGKVFCEFCGAPYPAESVACPNCGGRAHGAT